MCGIFGLIETAGLNPTTLQKMGQLLQHRGPDGEGYVLINPETGASLPCSGPATTDEVLRARIPNQPRRGLSSASDFQASIGLGHRRLAIVDLSPGGHQPMVDSATGAWIAFNGEIYNHLELREELVNKGYRFHSHSDTEVILKAYEAWGASCLSRFNGMFAFVLFHPKLQKFFIARDRFGVKPLYFWRFPGGVAFASEIKAFLADPRFSVQPNVVRLNSYLVNGPAEHDVETVFGGVERMPASTYIESDMDGLVKGSCRAKQWWAIVPNLSAEKWDESKALTYANRYLELLNSAVDLRRRADVTVGSALSGGLDSSSLVWLIAKQASAQRFAGGQVTFSSIYRSPGTEQCDESEYIERVASLLDIDMKTIEPHPHDVPLEHARMIWTMDTPPESTCMSGWHTFKLVQNNGIKVTLDGQGADEQLAGYKSYLAIQLASDPLGAIAQLPALLRIHERRFAVGAVGLALLGPVAGALGRFVSGRRRRVIGQIHSGLNAALADDCFHGLSNLLHYADRTSMAFGVESRMPFLDFRLAEFLAALPAVYKVHKGWTKHVARCAFDGKLPADIVWRKDKMGWPIPEEYWEQGPLKEWFSKSRCKGACSEMENIGLGEAYSRAIASNSIEVRVRALNLNAWRNIFMDSGWKAFAA